MRQLAEKESKGITCKNPVKRDETKLCNLNITYKASWKERYQTELNSEFLHLKNKLLSFETIKHVILLIRNTYIET